MAGYRPPADCPVCRHTLELTQLGCPSCGTALSGRFQPCEFCALDDADREVLRVFLASRGNMKDLERHLQVSYPTARARFENLLRKLGLGSATGTAGGGDGGNGGAAEQSIPQPDARLEALRAVAAGTLDVEAAARLLGPGRA